MQLNKEDNEFFKQIEKEFWETKYEKLKYLENKIKDSMEKSESLPVENSAYMKKEILPHLKQEYYKTYIELNKHFKTMGDNK